MSERAISRGAWRWQWRLGATPLLCAAALLLHAIPATASHLEFARTLAAAQPWRILGCHLVHWNASHLFWDVLTLAVLGTWCERFARTRLVVAVTVSALSIPPAVALLVPALESYRGLSGIDAALCALLGVQLLRTPGAVRWCAGVALGGLLLKACYEYATGQTLFAAAGGSFVPVPLAHLVGGAAGLMAGVLPGVKRWGASLEFSISKGRASATIGQPGDARRAGKSRTLVTCNCGEPSRSATSAE